MKTYKDYLIDFDTLEVGDSVWSSHSGNGIITSLQHGQDYAISVSFKGHSGYLHYTFTKDGKFSCIDKIVGLFKEKPDFFKDEKEIKRWRWYFETNFDDEGEITCNKYTQEEFTASFPDVIKYEKINCTEITEVVYE